MRLTDRQSIQNALGNIPTDDLNTAVEDAIDAATDELSAWIRTEFDQQARQDDYMVDYRRLLQYERTINLKLTQGFVNASPAITVVAARNATDLNDPTAVTDITANCDIDYEKGVISFSREVQVIGVDWDLRGTTWQAVGASGNIFFRVSYTAGFADDGTTYTGIPDWLKRAASLKVRIMLDQHPVFRQNMSATDGVLLQQQFSRIMDKRIRYTPRARTPDTTRKING